MRSPWFNACEKADTRGARMHVCMYAFCVCTDCQVDPELRRLTAIDRSEPKAPKVIGGAL